MCLYDSFVCPIVIEHKKKVKEKLSASGRISHIHHQDLSPELHLSRGLAEERCAMEQDTCSSDESYKREFSSRAGQASRLQKLLNCKCVYRLEFNYVYRFAFCVQLIQFVNPHQPYPMHGTC